jgi:hypothetical protein
MVICPIALAVHCTGCLFFKFCPAKTTLGDYNKQAAEQEDNQTKKDTPKSEKS